MKIIGSAQTHPIILAALDKFTATEFERLLRLLEVIIVRYQLIGGERTGRLEIQCAKTAKEIFDGDVKTAVQAKESLKDIYVSDSDFRQAFQTKEERSSPKAHYLLRKLEIEERRIASSDGARVTDPGIGLTIEHILPKNPGPEWDDIISDDLEMRIAFIDSAICVSLESSTRKSAVSHFRRRKLNTEKPMCSLLGA